MRARMTYQIHQRQAPERSLETARIALCQCFLGRLFLVLPLGAGPYHFAPLVSRPVGEALADDALQCAIRAGGVVHAKLDAVVIAEIELGKVAMADASRHSAGRCRACRA